MGKSGRKTAVGKGQKASYECKGGRQGEKKKVHQVGQKSNQGGRRSRRKTNYGKGQQSGKPSLTPPS